MQHRDISIAMIGATGAVGGETLKELTVSAGVSQLSLFGRRRIESISSTTEVQQHQVDIFEPLDYKGKLVGHHAAICTLGVGEPTKVSKESFIKIDKLAVIDFAKACKEQGVQHFSLLASVGANSTAASFYLRTKGELIEALIDLKFERLSLFQPSMILTPTNRYGWTQWLTLKIWPLLTPLLLGGLKKYRGIKVATLGKAMARNVFNTSNDSIEYLQWKEFNQLADR